MSTAARREWEARLLRAAAGELDSDRFVAERTAVSFLLSDDPEVDLHTATVWAELVGDDIPAEERVEFARTWLCQLRDTLQRGQRPMGRTWEEVRAARNLTPAAEAEIGRIRDEMESEMDSYRQQQPDEDRDED